jgi:hypothetical protein
MIKFDHDAAVARRRQVNLFPAHIGVAPWRSLRTRLRNRRGLRQTDPSDCNKAK